MNTAYEEKNQVVKKDDMAYVKDWIEHYNRAYQRKLKGLNGSENYDRKVAKFSLKMREDAYIVLRAIKKKSLKLNDKGRLKIRKWPIRNENGERMKDEKQITLKVERYDIIALVRLLKAAQDLGEDVFEQFLGIYDVKEIIHTVKADYFGDLATFLSRRSI